MRKIGKLEIFAGVFFLFLLQIICFYVFARRTESDICRMSPVHCTTVADRIVAIESTCTGRSVDMTILDRIIELTRSQVGNIKKPYSLKEGNIILAAIANAIKMNKITYSETSLLSDSLGYAEAVSHRATDKDKFENNSYGYHYADCDTLSLIYLSVGDALNLPIELVEIPGHVFVSFSLSGGKNIYWEATNASVQTLENIYGKIRSSLSQKVDDSMLKQYMRIYNKDNIASFTYEILAGRFLKSKKTTEALNYCLEAEEIYPGNLSLLLSIAAIYALNKNQDKYIEYLLKAKDADYYGSVKVLDTLYYLLSNYYYDYKQYSKCIEYASKYLAAHNNEESKHDHYCALYIRAASYIALGEYHKAIQDTSQLLGSPADKRTRLNALRVKINAYCHLEDYDKAISDAKEILEKNPDDVRTLLFLLEIYDGQKKEYAKSKMYYDKLSELNLSGDDRLFFLRAKARLESRNGNLAEAVSAYDEALNLAPGDADLWNSFGIFYHENMRDFARSYEALSQAYQLSPENISIRANFSEACLTDGKYIQAIEIGNKVLSSDKLSPYNKLAIKFIMATALKLEGKNDESSRVIEEIKKMYSSSADYRKTTWNFAGTQKFIQNNKKLTDKEKAEFTEIIRMLETDKK